MRLGAKTIGNATLIAFDGTSPGYDTESMLQAEGRFKIGAGVKRVRIVGGLSMSTTSGGIARVTLNGTAVRGCPHAETDGAYVNIASAVLDVATNDLLGLEFNPNAVMDAKADSQTFFSIRVEELT